MADLDDTTNCPLDACCATCATEEVDDLIIATGVTQVGVFCFTLCKPCADESFVPRVGLHAAMTSVLEHCRHLGIDLDQAAELLERERAAVTR